MDHRKYEEMFELEKSNWWFIARRKILELLLSISHKPNQKILEIGSGTGGNIEMLLQYGDVTAIEPKQFAREKIQKKFSEEISLIDGKLPNQLNLGEKKFDLICLFDVLEHIEDDLAALVAVKKILQENGKVILTVPAFQFLWSQHDKNCHHFRRYNHKTLRELIKKSGFKIYRISYFNFLLFPIAFIVRIVGKIFPKILLIPSTNLKNNGVKKNNLAKKIVEKTLITIFSSEKFLLAKKINFPYGLSIFALLEK